MFTSKNIAVLWFCCFILLGCSKNGIEQDNSIEIYSNDTLISSNDLLSLRLGNTMDLKIESNYDSIKVFSYNNNIEIERYAANSYTCIPTAIGDDQIVIVPVNKTEDAYIVNVSVSGYKDQYLIVDCSYDVKVPSSSIIESEILNELQNSYIPKQYGIFSFNFATTDKGDFVYYKYVDKKDSIVGTFSIAKNSVYTLRYNNTKQTINISESSSSTTNTLTTDLVDIFKAKYPSDQIDSARITSHAHKSRVND